MTLNMVALCGTDCRRRGGCLNDESSMTQYAAFRTDKSCQQYIWTELEAGRLRQGWGWTGEQTYRGAEFEHLLVPLLESVYGEGSVRAIGGRGEKGADFIVSTTGPLGLVFQTAIQAKMYDGTQRDTHAIAQLRSARDDFVRLLLRHLGGKVGPQE